MDKTLVLITIVGCSLFVLGMIFMPGILDKIFLKKQQKEWDELKAALKVVAPHIAQEELREAFVNFVDHIEWYCP